MKFRVLIHCTSLYRDIGVSYILAQLLERRGCNCFIASNLNYVNRLMKLWNPHAVYYCTSSNSKDLMNSFPKAKFFFCDGEGGEPYPVFNERYFLGNPWALEKLSRLYLWGENAMESFSLLASENNQDLDALSSGRIVVNGHPRLDTIRYASKGSAKNEKIAVGFIGNASEINPVSGIHPIAKLLDHHNKASFDYYFDLICIFSKIIAMLGDKYSFSLRPYPLENRASYNSSKLVSSGTLGIDSSLDFNSWIEKQDIIIGDISSTFIHTYFAKKPFISIHKFTAPPQIRLHCDVLNNIKKNLHYNCPDSLEELEGMVKNYKKLHVETTDLNEYLHSVYNIQESGSVIGRIAGDMVHSLEKDPPNVGRGIPTPLLSAWDNRKYKTFRAADTTIPFFDYNQQEHNCSKEFDPVVENIVAHATGRIKETR